MALGVGVKEVVGPRVVLIDALFHQPHTENAAIEVQVLLRRPGNRGDVMQSVDAGHNH
jgi:hypothetical protein